MMDATNSLPANMFSTANQITQIPGMAPLIPPAIYTTAPPKSLSTPTQLPTFMTPPNVSLTGPQNKDEFNYAITNPATQQAVAQPLQNISYPLNATNGLTGQNGFDSFNTSSATGAPAPNNYTTTSTALPAPFKAATVKPDPTSITLDMNALLDPRNQAVNATAPVTKNPFEYQAPTTTIPGYPSQPGQQLSMLA